MTNPVETNGNDNVDTKNQQNTEFKQLEEKINSFNSENAENFELGIQLTAEFSKKITSDQAKDLLVSIKKKYPNIKDWSDVTKIYGLPEGIRRLINFLEPIANPFGNDLKDEDVAELEKDHKTEGKFYGSLKGLNKKPVDNDNGSDAENKDNESDAENKDNGNDAENKGKELNKLEQLYKNIEDALNLIPKNNGGNIIDERFNKLQSTLYNIQKVVDNPTKNNTKQLQKFIYESCYKNLGDNKDKKNFEKYNHMKNGEFDGQFGDVTLEGLNKLLDVIQKNIEDIKEAIAVENSQSTPKDSKSKESSDNSGNGVNTSVSASLDKPSVDQSSDVASSQTETSQQKPELPGGYKRVENLQVLGMALYSTTRTSQDVSGGWGIDKTQNEGQNLGNRNIEKVVQYLSNLGLEGGNERVRESVYLMEVGNEIYAVRLDNKNCLYPLAVNVTGGAIGKTVLIENNPSCMQYLINKMPDVVKQSGAKIGWDGSDYVIGGIGPKRLTIEPMTIAQDWMGASLSESLALLNFVNYLRNSRRMNGFDFDNDNPNLKWDDKLNTLLVKIKKNKDAKVESGSKHETVVPLSYFGLDFIADKPDLRSKFIKYNNGERWEDDWDKKKENRDYGRLNMLGQIAKYERKSVSRGNGNVGVDVSSQGISSKDSRSERQDSAKSESLTRVADSSLVSGLGFSAVNINIYESVGDSQNKTYYWQDGDKVFRLKSPYSVKESANGKFPGDLNVKNLTFASEDSLNVCEQGANALTKQLGEIYKEINSSDLPNDVVISKEDDNYKLKWKVGGVAKEISLNGDNFISNKKILGYPIERPEEWMKVVCYAYQNYDNIVSDSDKQLILNNSNEYGITDDNRDQVENWLKSLNTSNKKPELVVLPSKLDGIGIFDDDGKFSFDNNKVDTGEISIGGVDYLVNPDGSGLGVKWLDDKSELRFGNFVNGSLEGQGTSFYKPSGVDCVCKYECVFENNEPLSGGKFVHTWGVDSSNPSILSGNFQEDGNWPLTGTITCYDSGVQHTFTVGRPDKNSDWEIKDSEGYADRFIDFNTGVLKPKQS